ncbi:MAG TPA: ATP-binding protein [Polyangiaceae bacterium]|nr:ATP-binding protein [Polyangiaceae bacterium]
MISTTEPVTLANCESEPIHIPGAIQPHGVLVATRGPELELTQVSANLADFFAVAPEAALGRPFTELLEAESAERLRNISAAPRLREVNPFRIVSKSGRALDAVAHRAGEILVIEAEPVAAPRLESIGGFDPRLRSSVLRLQNAHDIASLTATAADEVRVLTGFDRVMVYRFDAEWNGEVVAESKRDDLESFLGWHYPASDIPAQARRLYTVNWLRFIVDVGYRPMPVVPTCDPVLQTPLDMSHAILRSVSPIHIEYLRNMGVRASMSISLVIDGELAGLIACHHYSGARLVPLRVRDTAEYLGYALSWQLRVLEGANRTEQARLAQRHEAELVRSISVASDLLDGLGTPALLALTGAQGAAVVLEEGVRRVGKTPSSEQIRLLVGLLTRKGEDVFATERLADELPGAAEWEDVAAGVLAVAIAPELGEYVIWFRPGESKVVNWGGDPRKVEVPGENGAPPRLSPRGSFALWEETVKGRSAAWRPWQVEAASSLRRVLLGGVRRRVAQLRQMNQQLIDADRAKNDFLATVSHELRTPLNAISGWAALLKSGGMDPKRASHALEVIDRNAQAQTQLVEDLLDVSRIVSGNLKLEVDLLDVATLLENAVESSAVAFEAKRLKIERELDETVGRVRGDANRLRQVITNLLTNAVKFTKSGGRIKIGLKQVQSSIEIAITDDGQGIEPEFLPHVFEPFRQQDSSIARRSKGLGLGLAIVKKLVELHGGQVAAESAGRGEGATFRIWLPISPFRAERASEPPTTTLPSPEGARLSGLQIMVIEDDDDSRELIVNILERAQATVHSVSDAIIALADLSKQHPFDVIVSDVGLPEMSGLDFLRALRARPSEQARRTPAVALTAYTRAADRTAAIEAGFQAHVPKPVDPAELVATIAALVGR